MIKNITDNNKNKIIELFEELNDVYHENDWLIYKKYILRYSHPDIRKLFSTRHHVTKKHTLNSFEKDLITYLFNNYNVKLTLKEEDTHYEQ